MTANKELIAVNETGSMNWENILENERSIAPLVDIYETNDDFILVANMPGVNRENVKVKLEEESLVIFGKMNNYDDAAKRKYLLNENEIANYYRRFRISNSIDETRISAKFENGQLSLVMPKHERIKPRAISIS
ncbi:MAG: Hsp20/alpha crystallin family protein [Ignavibacteriales bacterium]|nr:MAG: Hsp20/alpha crystallin family protein [Ignavibacteriales bacterium]